MRININSPPAYKEEKIASAERLEEVKPFLCYKSRGNGLKCVNCPDQLCKVGKKAREILDKMTMPTIKPEDPDCGVYKKLLSNRTKTPVYELIKTAEQALSFHPKRFTRKDAICWLEDMRKRNPEIKTEKSLEEALKEERRKDYERYLTSIEPDGIGEKRSTQITANAYGMRYAEAAAYVKELKREFGTDSAPVKQRTNTARDSGELTSEIIQQKYEEALTKQEILDEEYEERMGEIEEEIRILDAAIEKYTEIKNQIRTTEKRLEFSEKIAITKKSETDHTMMESAEDEEDDE